MIVEKNQLTCHIRWMIRRDMPEIMQIEEKCFTIAWTEEDFLNALRQRQIIGMIAEWGDKILGYMVYELHKDKLNILNFAVDPKYKRHTIGTQMINKLKSKLTSYRRTSLTAAVRESNLDAQLFFKKQSFKCVKILNRYYNEEDGYKFKYKLENA